MGDFGGVAEVLTTVAAALIRGSSEHNYLLKAIAKLFFAKTKDPYLFESKKGAKAQRKK